MTEKHEEHKHHAEHEEHKHLYMEHHQHQKNKGYMIATWILTGVSVLLLVGLILALTLGGNNSANGASASLNEVKAQTETYLKGISQGQASVDNITEEGGLYKLGLTVSGRQYESYVTKDGKLLFPQGIDMSVPVPAAGEQAAPTPTVVPKNDKPVVELFVMSHCPYGTQAEKGILPAVRALGNKVDFKIRFVNYAMHGEKEVKEQLVQHCIQTEQNSKYVPYLACFLNDSTGGGSATASDACIVSTGVDKAKLEACKVKADAQFSVTKNLNDKSTWKGSFPMFAIDDALNTKYGVGGSPTLIINGADSNAGRDSASYLAGICAAFNVPPAECETVLSSTQPGPGFGYDSVGAANAAGCGA
jgi:hypothetical protein